MPCNCTAAIHSEKALKAAHTVRVILHLHPNRRLGDRRRARTSVNRPAAVPSLHYKMQSRICSSALNSKAYCLPVSDVAGARSGSQSLTQALLFFHLKGITLIPAEMVEISHQWFHTSGTAAARPVPPSAHRRSPDRCHRCIPCTRTRSAAPLCSDRRRSKSARSGTTPVTSQTTPVTACGIARRSRLKERAREHVVVG